MDKYFLRGGSWSLGSWYARAASRYVHYPPAVRDYSIFGFRVLGVPKNRDKCVLRGGPWFDGTWNARTAARDDFNFPDSRDINIGFRVSGFGCPNE